MNCQGISFLKFLYKNQTITFVSFFALFSALFIISLIFDLGLLLPTGIAFFFLFSYFIQKRSKETLFILIIVRMLLDYPGEKFSLAITESFFVSVSQIIGIAILIAGILYLFKNKEQLRIIPLKIPILIYLLFSLITSLYSIQLFSTIAEFLRLFDIFLLYFLSYSIIKTKKDFIALLNCFLISSIIPIAVAIYQYITGIGYTDSSFEISRIYGTFSHPNLFSLYLFIIIAILTLKYFLMYSPKKPSVGTYALFIIYFSMLVLTYTRVSWIAVLIFFFIIGMFKFRKVLLIGSAIVVFIFIFSPFVQERVQDAISSSPTSSLEWRKGIWSDAISKTYSEHRYILGYGSSTFEAVAEDQRGIALGDLASHNDYVRAFVEGGLFGLAVYIFYAAYILLYFLYATHKAKNKYQNITFFILFAIFFSMAIASITDNIIRDTTLQWIFWLLTGGVLAIFSKKTLKSKNA